MGPRHQAVCLKQRTSGASPSTGLQGGVMEGHVVPHTSPVQGGVLIPKEGLNRTGQHTRLRRECPQAGISAATNRRHQSPMPHLCSRWTGWRACWQFASSTWITTICRSQSCSVCQVCGSWPGRPVARWCCGMLHGSQASHATGGCAMPPCPRLSALPDLPACAACCPFRRASSWREARNP